MDDLTVHLKLVTKYTTTFILICAAGSFLMPQYQPYILGFALGAAAGLVNAYYLSAKIVQMANRIDEQVDTTKLKRSSIGFLTRASIAILAVLLAINSDFIAESATILGLIVVPMIALFIGYITARNKQ